MSDIRRFPVLERVECNGVTSIKSLPIYLEIAFEIFEHSFSDLTEEDRRWSFLLWAYEDENNGIYRHVRNDAYVNSLFSTPHKIQLSDSKIVVMHEYHYRYFRKHIKSFESWGFDSIEKNPERYLYWFYTSGEDSHLPYAKATTKYKFKTSLSGGNLPYPPTVMNLPVYIELEYLVRGIGFKDSLESDRRWSYLKWACEDKQNLNYPHILNDQYITALRFKTCLSGGSLPSNPTIMNLPAYLESDYLSRYALFEGKSEEDRRWSFLLWAYEDENNGIYRHVRNDAYVNSLFSAPHKIQLSDSKVVVMHEYHYRYFRKHIKSFESWGFESIEKNPQRYLDWFYEPDISNRIPYSKATRDSINDW